MPSKVPSPVSEQPRRADTASPIEHRRRDRRDQWITSTQMVKHGNGIWGFHGGIPKIPRMDGFFVGKSY